MPGFNRTEQEQIAAIALAVGQQSYAQVAQKLVTDSNALLNETLRQNFKKPSVFAVGTGFNKSFSYTISASDLVSKKDLSWTAAGSGTLTVFVFNIQDADYIRVVATLNAALGFSNVAPPLILAYALSPFDAQNQIPCDQFALSYDFKSILYSANYYAQAGVTIETAGNKYLHLFGVAQTTDLMPLTNVVNTTDPNANLSYALIK